MGTPPESQWLEGGEEHVVDSILDHRWQRVHRGHETVPEKKFLVRWKGHGPAEDTWVWEENLNIGGTLKHWRDYVALYPDPEPPKGWGTVRAALSQLAAYAEVEMG